MNLNDGAPPPPTVVAYVCNYDITQSNVYNHHLQRPANPLRFRAISERTGIGPFYSTFTVMWLLVVGSMFFSLAVRSINFIHCSLPSFALTLTQTADPNIHCGQMSYLTQSYFTFRWTLPRFQSVTVINSVEHVFTTDRHTRILLRHTKWKFAGHPQWKSRH